MTRLDAMLPPTVFLYRAHTGALPATGDASCWLCAWPCPVDGPAAGDVVRSTFTDSARARRGGRSEVCCAACAWYFDHKIMRPGQKRAMGFFTKTIRAWPDRWEEWDREAMADDLLAWGTHGLPDDALVTINFSKQKHVVPWAVINRAGTYHPMIETDIGRIAVPDALPELLRCVAALWGAGHFKGDIARGVPTATVLAKAAEPARHLARCAVLQPYVGSPTMDLLTYLVTETNRDRLAGLDAPLL